MNICSHSDQGQETGTQGAHDPDLHVHLIPDLIDLKQATDLTVRYDPVTARIVQHRLMPNVTKLRTQERGGPSLYDHSGDRARDGADCYRQE